MTTDLQALIQHLRGVDWNLRAPQEMADMIADKLEAALAAAPSTSPAAAAVAGIDHRLHEWAVSRWRDEVEHRPLVNIHRRTLDDTWRQVIRFAGGDPDSVIGAPHDALLAAAPAAAEPVIHGVNCPKAPHTRGGSLHDENDDTPFDVDGVRYCGRCHRSL